MQVILTANALRDKFSACTAHSAIIEMLSPKLPEYLAYNQISARLRCCARPTSTSGPSENCIDSLLFRSAAQLEA